jgi:hypothetical protein
MEDLRIGFVACGVGDGALGSGWSGKNGTAHSTHIDRLGFRDFGESCLSIWGIVDGLYFAKLFRLFNCWVYILELPK